jgi:hypothetical protein
MVEDRQSCLSGSRENRGDVSASRARDRQDCLSPTELVETCAEVPSDPVTTQQMDRYLLLC